MRDALRNMGKPIAAADILLLGASYREDVGDTRYSGSELIVRKLTEMGADVRVHDPYVEHWWEFEAQETYPAPGYSLARFFHRQETLQRSADRAGPVEGHEGGRRHRPGRAPRRLPGPDPDEVVEAVGEPFAVIDCFCILDDDQIRRYFELGCEVKGMGRGHIHRIKESVRGQTSP